MAGTSVLKNFVVFSYTSTTFEGLFFKPVASMLQSAYSPSLTVDLFYSFQRMAKFNGVSHKSKAHWMTK